MRDSSSRGWSRVSPYGICGGQRSTATSLSLTTVVSPVNINPKHLSSPPNLLKDKEGMTENLLTKVMLFQKLQNIKKETSFPCQSSKY
jgi:hypothetical protein